MNINRINDKVFAPWFTDRALKVYNSTNTATNANMSADANTSNVSNAQVRRFNPKTEEAPAVDQYGRPINREANEEVMRNLLSNAGFSSRDTESMISKLSKQLAEYDVNTVDEVFVSQLEEYKKRFIANETRKKQGLAPLPESAYLDLERQYASILRRYNLPAGFYDDPKKDFVEWIAKDISPVELESRAQTAFDWANSLDQTALKTLKQYYNIDASQVAAYALDSKRALPVLQRQAEAVRLGTEALRQNFNVSRQFSEQLAEANIQQETARAAFNIAAEETTALQQLSTLEGRQNVTAENVVESTLGLNAEAKREIQGLKSRERARFGGTSGKATGILGSEMSGSY